MNLSKNFTLEELTYTNTGLPNVPTEAQIVRLTDLVTKVLQPLREQWGKPIRVNSGFRSEEVNKAVKGAPTSQHCKGEAADIEADNNAGLFQMIRQGYTFDQLIWEGGSDLQPNWVHVSYHAEENRNLVLRMKVVDGVTKYIPM
jgi:zinc D-Ala-D-Ala carboxypeptidase